VTSQLQQAMNSLTIDKNGTVIANNTKRTETTSPDNSTNTTKSNTTKPTENSTKTNTTTNTTHDVTSVNSKFHMGCSNECNQGRSSSLMNNESISPLIKMEQLLQIIQRMIQVQLKKYNQ